MIELSQEAFAFWQQTYVAAIAAKHKDPKATAEKAVEHFTERVTMTRAAMRLGALTTKLSGVERETREGRKINAIKELRAIIPGIGLKEAKDAVEQYERSRSWPDSITIAINNLTALPSIGATP